MPVFDFITSFFRITSVFGYLFLLMPVLAWLLHLHLRVAYRVAAIRTVGML